MKLKTLKIPTAAAVSALVLMSAVPVFAQELCGYCNGTGNIMYTETCGTCSGIGSFEAYESCSACFGTGSITEDCSNCFNNGQIYDELGSIISCPTCNGMGTIASTCPECGGQSRWLATVPCTDCSSMGYQEFSGPCPDCGGTGYINTEPDTPDIPDSPDNPDTILGIDADIIRAMSPYLAEYTMSETLSVLGVCMAIFVSALAIEKAVRWLIQTIRQA